MRNNWLSFTISEENRDTLYSIVLEISESVKFTPMSYEDLHMTAVFMGRDFKSKNKVLSEKLDRCLQKFGKNIFDTFQEDTVIVPTKLSFFPPEKCNLIVLEYSCNKKVKESLQELKETLKHEFNLDIKEEEYCPHITLGKLNLTKKELATLKNTDFMDKINKSMYQLKNNLSIRIDSNIPLYLCGE